MILIFDLTGVKKSILSEKSFWMLLAKLLESRVRLEKADRDRAPVLLNPQLIAVLRPVPVTIFLFRFRLFTSYPVRFFAGTFQLSMGARNQVWIGFSYRPARLHRLEELIPRNRFLISLNVQKFGLCFRLLTVTVPVPAPYLDHKRQLSKIYFGENLAFLHSKLFTRKKTDKFHQIYCKMLMKEMLNESDLCQCPSQN